MKKHTALRKFALFFDPHLTSEYDEVEIAVDCIFAMILAVRKEQGKRVNDPANVRLHVKVILLNVYQCLLNAPYIYCAISMRSDFYSRPEDRYLKVRLSIHHIGNVIDELESFGFIKVYPGYQNVAVGEKHSTRILALPALAKMMEDFGVNRAMFNLVPIESIRLRDKEKKLQDYTDTIETNQMRSNLLRINESLRKIDIQLAFTEADWSYFQEWLARGDGTSRLPFLLTSIELHRVFNNGSWTEGGRFYGGWWQSVPQKFRPYIVIDGKMTTELDYSSLHIKMLYAEMELECPDDAYDLPIKDFPREHQKAAIVTMLNAGSDKKAIASLRFDGGIANAKELCAALKKRHAPIGEHFYKGDGVRLQFLDSQIAEAIMLKALDLGFPVLPLHDSFIVDSKHEAVLRQMMEEAFSDLLPGTIGKSKRKKTLYDYAYKGPDEPGEQVFLN